MKISEEKWEKIDRNFGLRYIPVIGTLTEAFPDFLKIFKALDIKNIRALSGCKVLDFEELIYPNPDYLLIIKKVWYTFLSFYNDSMLKEIKYSIDYIENKRNIREKFGNLNKAELDELVRQEKLNIDDLEDLMEFKQLEEEEVEDYLYDERIEFDKLSAERMLLENPSLKEKVVKIFENILKRSRDLLKNPESLITFYMLE